MPDKRYPLYYKLDQDSGGADVSSVTATAGDVDTGKVFVDSTGSEVTGTSTAKTDYQNLNNSVKGLIDGTTTTFTIPEGVTSIRERCFSNMSNLITVNMPNTLTDINNYTFHQCTNLELTELPSGVTSIGNYAFGECSKLNLSSLPSGLTSISSGAFYKTSMRSLTSLPSGVTTIGNSAFGFSDVNLTSLPNGLTSIGMSAFSSCSSLTEITFLGTPTTIHAQAFQNCTNLTTIRVPWQEGEVSGAPWGAVNSSIIYGYTPS